MLRLTDVKLPLDHDDQAINEYILDRLSLKPEQLTEYTVFRRGYDARKRDVIILMYTLDVTLADSVDEQAILAKFEKDQHVRLTPDMSYKFVAEKTEELEQRPVVIGFGPCGLFTALILAQMGLKPIVLERGKEVRERTKDTFGFWRKRELNPESNVQFGEGGAGTFSDGKLYSQVKDPKFHARKILTEFVKAGAPEEIMYLSKPHIGTFKLVTMIERMRKDIIELGGEIRFSARVDDILIENDQVSGVELAGGEIIETNHVSLAIGHSARDTFEMLQKRGVYLEAKPFSIGFRIEHKQSAIDNARFGKNAGNPLLGSADYKLVHHCKNGRSVYSFCMCPGGTVVAATSEEGHVVTNGMSQYSRNEMNANSAIVVGITPEDFPGNPLAGIDLQRKLEKNAFVIGGSNYDAPGQTVGDFLNGSGEGEFGDVVPSYKPGLKFTDLSKTLPPFAVAAIREAIPAFEKKIKGFSAKDATLTGVETRTSSPVSIKRGRDFQSISKVYTLQVKVLVMLVAFYLLVLMVSKWLKQWRFLCLKKKLNLLFVTVISNRNRATKKES